MSTTRLPFEDVFADESGGNIKTPQSEYKSQGRFPVVDQGKSLIAGYVDEEERLCGEGRPAIVFGDHTRCVKYIDHPFCMGADGVKVLRSKIPAELKYLYYYLKQVRLPDAGYDRHFKYLKRTEIVLPPLEEQCRIVAILDKADSLCAKRREALAHLDRLAQSIFVEMFGDPATNPKGWPVRKIGDLLTAASYGTSEKSGPEGEFPVLRMNNITRTGEMDFADLKYMNLVEAEYDRYLVKRGDVLFNRTNSAELVGKTAIYRRDDPMAYAGYLIRLRANDENDPEYLAGFLNTDYAKRMLRSMCKSIIGMANINATEVQAMKIAQPPRTVQNKYRERIEGLVRAKSFRQRALDISDSLFFSLQHRAFRGEL